MAAPLASGMAALAISAGIQPTQVVDILTSTASVPEGASRSRGAGIVDAAAALGG